MAIIKFILYGLLGLCLGSFFNVIVTRDGWATGRSRCDACGHILSWYELIPIFSYLFLKGKCKKCKAKIDHSHIVAELFGLVGGLTFAAFEFNTIMLVSIVVLGFSAIMDFKTRLVSTAWVYVGILILGMIKVAQYYQTEFFWSYILLLLLTAVVFFLSAIVLEDFIGDGDFDIMFFMILSLGYFDFMYCIFYASIIGTVYAIIKRLKVKESVPFVPLFYLGYLATLLFQGKGLI